MDISDDEEPSVYEEVEVYKTMDDPGTEDFRKWKVISFSSGG